MRQVVVIDTWPQHDCTIGRLSFDGFKCFTLELPWRENARGVSCIPGGEYIARKRRSPSNGDVLEFEGVPNRSYIQLHAGNYTRQVRGCILVGDSVRYIDDDSVPDVTNSKKTLKKLLRACRKSVIVRVKRAQCI